MVLKAHGIALAHGIGKGARGIEKKINLYKEKKFIVKIMSGSKMSELE